MSRNNMLSAFVGGAAAGAVAEIGTPIVAPAIGGLLAGVLPAAVGTREMIARVLDSAVYEGIREVVAPWSSRLL